MQYLPAMPCWPYVAPLAGSVDRNLNNAMATINNAVAPLAGSVDRNYVDEAGNMVLGVAPLAGSVDRNIYAYRFAVSTGGRSPRGERG